MLINKAHKKKVNNEENADVFYGWANFFSIIIPFFLVFFNKFALGFLINEICDREKWNTHGKMNVSFGYKLTIALFFNNALITLIVELISFNNYYGVGGMIYLEFIIFILNSFVPALSWIIDPSTIAKNLKRKKEMVYLNSTLT